MTRRAAFTLLEVAVAVAILGLALTAVFSSEAGAIKVGHRARNTGVATLLARCKMAEIEEQVHDQGLPAVEADGSDKCCDGAEVAGYSCDWKIERIVLPDLSQSEMPDGGAADEQLQQAATQAQATAAGNDTNVEQLLQGTGGTGDAITQVAIDFAFPILKPAIEDQVRRATVTVKWREGTEKHATHSFDVVEYLVGALPSADQSQDSSGQSSTQGSTQGATP